MKQIKKLKAYSAMSAIVTFILIAIVVICGIWIDGLGELYGKLLGTGFVILALSCFLHVVFNGMDSDR